MPSSQPSVKSPNGTLTLFFSSPQTQESEFFLFPSRPPTPFLSTRKKSLHNILLYQALHLQHCSRQGANDWPLLPPFSQSDDTPWSLTPWDLLSILAPPTTTTTSPTTFFSWPNRIPGLLTQHLEQNQSILAFFRH